MFQNPWFNAFKRWWDLKYGASLLNFYFVRLQMSLWIKIVDLGTNTKTKNVNKTVDSTVKRQTNETL